MLSFNLASEKNPSLKPLHLWSVLGGGGVFLSPAGLKSKLN